MEKPTLENLSGMRVYVTGTSRGIGAALAETALQYGAKVVGTSHHSGSSITHQNYEHIQSNAGDVEHMGEHVTNVIDVLGGLDVVVFGACDLHCTSPFDISETPEEYAKRLVESNAVAVNGPLVFMKHATEKLGIDTKIVYVFFGSVGEGVYGQFVPSKEQPGMPSSLGAYMPQKAFCSMTAKTLQAELGLKSTMQNYDGARLLLVQPQVIKTDLGIDIARAFGMTQDNLASLTPSGMVYEPSDAAQDILSRALEMYSKSPGADMGDVLVPRVALYDNVALQK